MNPEFLYATTVNQIFIFAADPNTGALSTPTAISGPSRPAYMTTNPSGSFLFVSDNGSGVYVYSINAATGALTSIVGSPFSVQSGSIQSAVGLAMDPAGKTLYAVIANNEVAALMFNSSTGQLTPIAGSPYSTIVGNLGNVPTDAAIDPAGNFLYVTDTSDPDGNVSVFKIDAGTGSLALIPGSPFPTVFNVFTPQVENITVHPSGKFLYVTEFLANGFVAASINGNGALAPIGSPYSLASVRFVTVDPSGKFLYAGGIVDQTVFGYAIDANTGALSATPGSPSPVPGGLVFQGQVLGAPEYGAVDPSGKFLYVLAGPANGVNTITGYNIDSSTGALSQFTSQQFSGQGINRLVAIAPK